MNIPNSLFVEVEPWEATWIKNKVPSADNLLISKDILSESDAKTFWEIEVLSPFIHSRIDAHALDNLPKLKLIVTRSTGVDHIDVAACEKRGVLVCNVPTYGANTVAEHTFGLILSLTRRVHRAYEQTSRGRFSIEGLRGVDLRDRTIGVVSTGAIGTHVIRIALGFQMRVMAYDINPVYQMADALGFSYVELDQLLTQSDIVSLHAPHNPGTHHMIDDQAIAKMKPGAILINTARGALVDTDALVSGLLSGHLGGAGLDVLEDEQVIREEGEMLSRRYDERAMQTLVQNTRLLRMDNVIVTPHIAFNSQEALDKILDTTWSNMQAFLAGRPQNVVVSQS